MESMSIFKKNAKRVLVVLLTGAIVLTSEAVPNSVASVQAATVQNNVEVLWGTTKNNLENSGTYRDAINALESSDEVWVKLATDTEIVGSQSISNGKIFHLDLAGHKLSKAGSDTYTNGWMISPIIDVNKGGTYYLEDSSEDKTGTVDSELKRLETASISGTFIMNGGTITGALNEGVYVINGGKFIMNDGKISGNKGDSSVKKTKASGGVYLNKGSFEMNGGEISNNKGVENGGAIGMQSGCNFTMNGGTITQNSSTENGGAINLIAASAESSINLEGGTISDNNAESLGGAIFCQANGAGGSDARCKINIGNVRIENNHALGGGAISTQNGCDTVIDGAVITGNTALVGGAAYIISIDENENFELKSGTISNNNATAQTNGGGGIYARYYENSNMYVKISGGSIKDNKTVDGKGSALLLRSDKNDNYPKVCLSGSPDISGDILMLNKSFKPCENMKLHIDGTFDPVNALHVQLENYDGIQKKVIALYSENLDADKTKFSSVNKSYGVYKDGQEIYIEKRMAPEVQGVNETINGKADGSITGVSSEMEYRKDGEENYTKISGDSVSGLSAGTYYVRYKANDEMEASEETMVIIKSGKKLKVELPEKQEGYTLSADQNTVNWHENIILNFTVQDGWDKGENFAIKVNGKILLPDKNGDYIINEIEEDGVITVEGIVKKLDITAADVIKMYDGNSYGITVDTDGIPNASVTYGTEAGIYDLTECPTYKNVGTYTIYYKVDARGYNSFTGSATVTINPKKVTATVSAKDKAYDGTTDATVSAVVEDSDLVSGDKITITGITGTFEDQNAGTEKKVTVDSSKAEYAGTGVDNYDITIGTDAKASINKLTAEFKWSNTDLTYNGDEQSVTAEVSNAISGDKFMLTYDGNKQSEVGNYTAKVTALGNDNYELPSEENSKTDWKISYLTKGNVTVLGTKGDNDWYVSKVTLIPESGYEISENGTDWTDALSYEAQGSQTATYYLKETATGFVSDQKTDEFKIDTEFPTGEIKIEDNSFKELLNTITFHYFFKNTVDVTIQGVDETSDIAKIKYQKVAKDAEFDKNGTWIEGSSFGVTANDKGAIYARITDNAGNSVIINSDGIVVYTDATKTATETFTKLSEKDITTGITVNGNTIDSIKNGDEVVAESAYEIKDDKLVLKASYLQTLTAGTYTLTVSYHPYGEAYLEDSKGEAPDHSEITLTVVKAEGSISDISDISKIYDGKPVTAPTFTTTNDRGAEDANVTIEYKEQGADDSTYTSEAPYTSGDYVVRITIKGDENYKDVTRSEIFKISPKEIGVSWSDTEFIYNGKAHKPTATVNSEDIFESDQVAVTVSGEQTNAGTDYTATATLDNTNYVIKPDSAATTFVVKPAPVIVTVTNAKKHIGKEDPEFKYTAEGLAEGESLENITITRAEGETAGVYDITATAEEGANPNYDVTFVAGKFTIEPHVIAETPVEENRVEPTCTEDGSYDEVYYCTEKDCGEVLKREKKIINALGHDWSGEWVTVIEPTATKEGRQEKICKRDGCGQKLYQVIPKTGDTDEGKIEKDAEVVPGAPVTGATLDNKKSELMEAGGIFTAEEKTAIENGADARVWLEISATGNISDEDKLMVENEAKAIMGSDISKVVYFDANLFKSVAKDGNIVKSQITEPGTDIKVSVGLPESLIQADSTISRAYKIIRLHGGVVDCINADYDKETETLSFKTDRFSTYAIAFTDTQLVTGVTISGDNRTLTKEGETVQLTATVTPDNAANKKVTWISSDNKVATVDENGVVTAVANGTVTITVTTEDGGKTATITITVNIPTPIPTDTTTEPTTTEPTTTEPITEEPTTTEPATEPTTEPTTTEPATEPTAEPTTTEPVTEPTAEPTTTEPTTTEPVTEPTAEPTTEPVTEPTAEPTTTEPVTEPTTTEPATEPTAEPTTTEPVTEPTAEPTTTEPATEPTAEPTTTEPVTEPTAEPTTTEPATEPTAEPTTTEPVTEPTAEPTTTEPVTTEPTTEPATTKPATTEPATTEPATTELTTTEPATTEPATTEPATTEPATTEPATTEPTTKPATTEPTTTEPATTEPTTTEPATTEPATTEPATTEPATTEPATTEPTTTEPATTEPATTEPATTEPATTEPATTAVTVSEKVQEKNALVLNSKLKSSQTGNQINNSWGKVKGASGYDVYVQYCGQKFNKKSLNQVKSGNQTKLVVKKVNGKKLNLRKNYKVYVEAYKLVDGKKVVIGKTITAHIVGRKNYKRTNVKQVKVKKRVYNLSVGKKAKIKASTVLVDKTKKPLSDIHAKELRYASGNRKIATVTENGQIKAVAKGTCTIYVYARNGYAKKVKVTVK